MNINKYTIKDATHYLRCEHNNAGKNQPNYYYKMKCLILGITKSGKRKILVFGNRYWKGYDHISKIRYVDSYRMETIK